MKISRFIHIIDDNTLWDAIKREKIIVDKDIIDYVQKYKNQEILEQIPTNIMDLGIITTKLDEERLISKLIEMTTDKQFQSLYLITTTSCNLDCEYCFYRSSFSKSLNKHQNMSISTAKMAIDKFYNIVKNNIIDDHYWQQITFYGGEPLLNKELLKFAIPYAKTKFNDEYTSLVINTNILLLDEEILNLFKKYNVEVQVSIDGYKEQHDLYRKDLFGNGSYDKVVSNIQKLIKHGIKVLPMITATDNNVHEFSKVLKYLIELLHLEEYAVNILITNSYQVKESYSQILSKEMLNAYRQFGDKAFDYVFVDLYNKIIGKDKTISKNSCGSSRKITVFPDEKVYACQALEKVPENSMGSLTSDFINNPNWNIWTTRSRFTNDKCLDCEALTLCGGGCATGSFNKNKNVNDIDENNCKYTKSLMKLVLQHNDKKV